ncbi:hypothetical protein [Streptomyces sp. KS 21]|uniref:hypothetical protein n=1 Tax=Streptomyces sp. KS 21 TaxID=2485150 RepID=UPI001FB9EDD5|nr:hypothetical protein [Streptomyces sp. KS 21]
MSTIKTYPQDQLAAQPIGCRSREAATLTLTRAGEEGRIRAHDRNAEVHTRYRQGLDDTPYAATIDTLRRMVANLGGDGDLP